MNDTGGEFSELVADTGTAATTYTDNTVAASTHYTYRIKAINEHGVSERSRWFHIETLEVPVPVSAAVQGLEDSGDGHLYPSYRFFRKAFGRARSLRARSISVRRPATTWSPTTEVQKSLPLSGRVLRTNPRHTGER